MERQSLRMAYGEALVEEGKTHPEVVVLEADLGKSTMSCLFKDAYPERYFEMGIAEQNMATTAAGLALAGKVPFYSTFAVFAVSFLARPFGGLVFGPLGDKIGRQKTLAITMLAMSIATGAIGLLPSFSTAGWWAFAGLIICRLIQGFSTGGEYSGATTFVSEYSPDKRRGYFSSFLDTGSYLGFAVGAAVVADLGLPVSEAEPIET